jgi:hypothetical protein
LLAVIDVEQHRAENGEGVFVAGPNTAELEEQANQHFLTRKEMLRFWKLFEGLKPSSG